MGLKILDLEKHSEDTIIFPSFYLEVEKAQAVAIYSNVNIRTILLQMFSGRLPIVHGQIYVNEKLITNNQTNRFNHLGIFLLDDGLYERLTVKDYLSFYRKLYGVNSHLDEILRLLQLETKRNEKIKKLTYSEKRRVHFARLLLQNPEVIIFEEPDQNVDVETKRVFIKMVAHLKQKGKSILVLTGNMETAITVTDQVYRLDENGLHHLSIKKEEDLEKTSKEENEESPIQPIRLEKIPVKVNEKIVLFDPPEIDYIESYDGQAKIYSKGEAFSTDFTLNELEERLQPFGFFRCHRSYIVNLQKVREIITWTRNSYSLVLDNPKKSSIPLSKSKMVQLKQMLGLK